jgi:hypothetical protein
MPTDLFHTFCESFASLSSDLYNDARTYLGLSDTRLLLGRSKRSGRADKSEDGGGSELHGVVDDSSIVVESKVNATTKSERRDSTGVWLFCFGPPLT